MSFLATYYPKKISSHLHGKNVYLRPPEYKDWQEWSQLRNDNMSYLKPWEPTWNIHELERSHFVKRVRFFEKLSIFLEDFNNIDDLLEYFDEFNLNLSKKTLNSYLKSVINP